MSSLSIPRLGPGYRLTVEDAPADADVDVLPHALEAYNEGQWPQHQPWLPLAIFLRDEARIVAGLAGGTYCGWLFVKYLWVSDGLRGRGVGRELMARAEIRARERGATRHGWIRSAFRHAVSTKSSAMRSSGGSTTRPATTAIFCASG